MVDDRASAKIPRKTLDQYRKWAKATGRNLSDLMDIALRFSLRKQSEIERELLTQFIDKTEAQ